MAMISQDAPLRDHPSFVPSLRLWFQTLIFFEPRPAPLPRTVSDRLARDIGVPPRDLERLRLKLPSEMRVDL